MTAPKPAISPRTQRLLTDPILPTLLRLGWPNLLVMLAQASTGMIETWWVSHLGTDALAGMALAVPLVMLMQMISAGSMGGGIAAAVARALGSGRRDTADALVLHAIAINVALGLGFATVMLLFGRPIFRALGGEGAALEAALTYSNIVFTGNVLLWLMNALSSVIRGTGNMMVPASVSCLGVALVIPLSPALIFGWGPLPAMGVAGGAASQVTFSVFGTLVLGWHLLSGRNPVRFRWVRLRWAMAREILRVGAVAAISSIQTNVTIALATALVAHAAGRDAVAGFGTGARLEYLLIPLSFGFGAPLVALVATNLGAGQPARALRVAMTGAAITFTLTEAVGIAVAIWPQAWLSLFSDDPHMVAAGSAYLRIVGPAYGFFGLGLSLYFAAQGAGRLAWPLLAGAVRLVVAIGGGALLVWLGAGLPWLFTALSLALVLYGAVILWAFHAGRVIRVPPG